MYRMSHPQHGFQMVQPADKPMFDRAGWSVVEPAIEPVIPEIEPEPEETPAEPKRRGRKPKVTA